MNGLFFGVCISWYNVPLLLSGLLVFIALQMIAFLHLVVVCSYLALLYDVWELTMQL